MKAIVVTNEAAGTAEMMLVERPEPDAAGNDVVVEVHASGFTPAELAWPTREHARTDTGNPPPAPPRSCTQCATVL